MARRAQHMSLAAAIAALPGVAAFGGALEQTNQSVDLLFESGTYLELRARSPRPGFAAPTRWGLAPATSSRDTDWAAWASRPTCRTVSRLGC